MTSGAIINRVILWRLGGYLTYHLSENPVSFIYTLFPDSPTWSAERIDPVVPGINSWHQPWPSSSQGNKSSPATPHPQTSSLALVVGPTGLILPY